MRDANRLSRRMVAAAIGLVFSSQMARAELPPWVYAKMQNEAGEFLKIEVLKREGTVRRGEHETSRFTLTAKVVCAARSASGLKPGATITIRYATVLTHPAGWAGGERIGIVEPGIYTAYLSKSGGVYAPVAQTQSFISGLRGAQPC